MGSFFSAGRESFFSLGREWEDGGETKAVHEDDAMESGVGVRSSGAADGPGVERSAGVAEGQGGRVTAPRNAAKDQRRSRTLEVGTVSLPGVCMARSAAPHGAPQTFPVPAKRV